MRKKVLSVLLVLAMIMTSADFTVLAAEQGADAVTDTEMQAAEENEESVWDTGEYVDSQTEEGNTKEETKTNTEPNNDATKQETQEQRSSQKFEESSQTQESMAEDESGSEAESETASDEESKEILEDVKATGKDISRVEWLSALTDTFEMTVAQENYPDNYFSDISTSDSFYHDVMLATEFGLIDVEAGEAFCPEDNATREFAVHTLNLCLQFAPEAENYTFRESDTVIYPDDIQVAVELEWFALDSQNRFLPDEPLKESEMNALIAFAKKEVEAQKIDDNYHSSFSYKEGVIVLPEGVDAALTDEDEITLTDCDVSLKAGDIFGIVKDGFPFAKRVEQIETQGNQKIIKVTGVTQEEAYESIDVQGSSKIPLTEVQAADTENMEISYIVGGTREKQWEDGEKFDSAEGLDEKDISAVEITKTYPLTSKQRQKFEIADGIDAEISCKILNVNADWCNNKQECMVKLNAEVVFSFNLSIDVYEALGVKPSLEVARVSVLFFGYASVTMNADLSGSATMFLLKKVSLGIKYDKVAERFRFIKDFETVDFTIQSQVALTLSETARFGFDIGVMNGNLYGEFGAKITLRNNTYKDGQAPTNCSHLESWLFANTGGYVKVTIGKKGPKLWDYQKKIFTRENSPARVSFHYEDGKAVDRCTRDKTGTMYKYYTPANSRYGYNGASSGTGADGKPYTIFEYSLNDVKEATITKYRGNVSALSIPKELDGYPVVGIGNSVFKGNTQLRMVVVPDSVTEIGNFAFQDCVNIESIELPDSITEIGSWAFRECKKLSDVRMPKKIKTLGSGVFYDCISITEMEIPKSLTTSDSSNFAGCINLKKITFEEGVSKIVGELFYNCTSIEEIEIPNTVTVIEGEAFRGCTNLTKIIIPNSVTKIGYSAFQDCVNIESMELPDSITEIGSWAFRECKKLSDVRMPKKIKTLGSGVFYDCISITEMEIPKSLTTSDSSNFAGCINLKKITFEEGVSKIVGELFYNCTSIEEIEIPDTVTVIEGNAFRGCTNLKKVNIPNSVTEISYDVFNGCVNIESIELPDSITEIGSWAFRECKKLSDVRMPKKIKTLGSGVFYDCISITEMEIPKSLTTSDSSNFAGCINLKKITFEEGVSKIVGELFYNCTSIEEIEIPDTVTVIEGNAFRGCTNLKKVNIPNSVTEISYDVFNGCVNIESIELPDSIMKIGVRAFRDCKNLINVKLPNTIGEINTSLFDNCTSLDNITLPSTVKYICSSAFYNTGLKELTLPENVIEIENGAFSGCTGLEKVIFNNKIKTIGNNAFYNNDMLIEIEIPDSVTSIGQYAFAHCDSLKDVKLGIGLTKIPSYAFNLCQSLEKIVLPYRVTTIESNAFTNCTKLTEVTIPRAVTSIASSVFSYPNRLTIYGISGTYAETYANQIGAKFVNKEVTATDVTLNDTTLSMITGAKHTLVMSVTPSDFTDEVVWKSSDTNIVTVDNTGVVTAKAVGTATVRVAVGEKTASCTVTVLQPVTYISLNQYRLSLEAFEEYTLTATVSPSDAADKSIEWTSSDETVATVSQTGKVTPLAKGATVIKATAKDGSGKYGSCNVTVLSDGLLCTTYSKMESDHNYANNTNKVWRYVHSGAKTLDITFDNRTNVDDGFDFIYLYDKDGKEIKKATGTELAGKTVRITGDTVTVKLVSDESIVAWGFKVTKISADGKPIDSGNETPEDPETSTEGSSEEESEPEEENKNRFLVTGIKTKTYTGSAVEQEMKVYYKNHLLQEGSDYAVSYKNNKNVGKALVTIKGKGNLTGSVTKTFQIQPRKINDTDVIIEDAVYTYDKKPHKKAPTITFNGKKLKEGKDYKVTDYGFGDYTASGTYTLRIEGIGNFTGSFDTAKVVITDKSKNISKAKIAKISVQEYQNGAAVVPADNLIHVELNKTVLKKDIDYTVSYANNTSVGKATLIVKGMGSYAGTKKVNFAIKRTPAALSRTMVKNQESFDTVEIVKGGVKPEPVLMADDETLVKGRDYTLSYKNNKAADADASVVIKGKGNYKGNITLPFSITTKSLTSETLSVRVPDVPYTGKANTYQSKPVITDSDGCILAANKDYVIESYSAEGKMLDKTSNPEEGTQITIVISGKGSYTGQTTVTYALRGMKFASATIKVRTKSYTGDAIDITENDIVSANIKVNKATKTLRFGEDYEIAAYQNNTKKGTASVTFRGIGDYAGEKTVKFKIDSGRISN